MRVGTLSMGISLIALGVILLVALLGGYGIIDQLFKWWPIILVIIGGEILLYVYRAQEDQPKIKYDFFSIFMIMVIFVSSGIFYAITSTGIAEQVSVNISSRDFSVMIPQKEISIDESIKKIVINTPNRATLEVNKTEGKNVIYQGAGEVFTESIEAAQAIVEGKQIYANQVEETLYLQFPTFERRQDIKTGVTQLNYQIFIPAGVDVELKGSNHYYSNITINGDAVKGNWTMNGINSVVVNGGADSNFILEVATDHRHELQGNVNWEIKEQESGYSIGKTTFGTEEHKLTILKARVEAMEL